MKILLPILVLTVSSVHGDEERFWRKYALTKMYESCFGAEVIKQIRQELTAAIGICANWEPALPLQTQAVPKTEPPQSPNIESSSQRPSIQESQRPPVKDNKWKQPILVYRPNPSTLPPVFYRPYTPPLYNQGFSNSFFQNPPFYPQYLPSYPVYGYPMYGQPLYNTRFSRGSQLDTAELRMNDRARNSTCVMQKMGYLDQNWEPDYEKLRRKVENLPASENFKSTLQNGISVCQQFLECLPDMGQIRPPFPCNLIRPMTFFKCYKLKKLEACIVKNTKEKLAGISNNEFESEMGFSRSQKSNDIPDNGNGTLLNDFLNENVSDIDIGTFL